MPQYVCASMKSGLFDSEALVGNENLETLEEGDYFGFCVDAGLGCM